MSHTRADFDAIRGRDYSGIEERLHNELERRYEEGTIGEGTYRNAQASPQRSSAFSLQPGEQSPDNARQPSVPQKAQESVNQPSLEGPKLAGRFSQYKDALLKIVAPAARSEGARQTSYVMREMGAKLANRLEQAKAALLDARKYFAAKQPQENFDFVDRIETGRSQKTLLRTLLSFGSSRFGFARPSPWARRVAALSAFVELTAIGSDWPPFIGHTQRG